MTVSRRPVEETIDLEWATPGTYTLTIPPGALYIESGDSVGGGGGGASGCKAAAGVSAPGGNGGNSGQRSRLQKRIRCVGEFGPGAILQITTGAGGLGGASVTANSTNGNPGLPGTGSSVSLIQNPQGAARNRSLFRGARAAAGGNAPVVGGTTNTAQAAVAAVEGTEGAEAGATGTNGAGVPPTKLTAMRAAPSGGPSGGGITAANVPSNGGQGGRDVDNQGGDVGFTGSAGGVVPGGNGTDAQTEAGNPRGQTMTMGLSGGGGAASITGNAGKGGLPAGYGAGGAGGGSSRNDVGNSGPGERGGDGYNSLGLIVRR